MADPAMAAARDFAERTGTLLGSEIDRTRLNTIDQLAEALRLCMKDLQEWGVIFAAGDPPYDLLRAYDEGRL